MSATGMFQLLLIATTLILSTAAFHPPQQRSSPRISFIDYVIREVDGIGRHASRVSSNRATFEDTDGGSSVSSRQRQQFNSRNVIPYGIYMFDLLYYFRSVPKRHWSCCMLGVLGGDKGFHCHVQFYANDIVERNLNRVHARSMDWYRRSSGGRRRRAMETMRAFGKCVNQRASEFKQCCEAATMQKIAYRAWLEHTGNGRNPWRNP